MHIKERLGEGSFGIVDLVEFRGKVYAAKSLKCFIYPVEYGYPNASELLADVALWTGLRRELGALKSIDHPNIVKLEGVIIGQLFAEKIEYPQYILMMYVDGGCLSDVLIHNPARLTMEVILLISIQTADGLAYLHSKQFIHRDIKPGNIMITDQNHITIADLGLARVLVSEAGNTKGAGTLPYMAPEVRTGVYSFTVDVYSLGCVILCMVSKLPLPMTHDERVSMLEEVKTYESKDLINALGHLIATDPELRPSAAEVVDILKTMCVTACIHVPIDFTI